MREYKLTLNGNDYTVSITSVSDEEVVADVNGETHVVAIKEIKSLSAISYVKTLPKPAPITNSSLVSPVANATGTMLVKAGMVVSPIPGHILEVCVAVGDKVLVGQKLLVLEAMKLENAITSEGTGVVKQILVAAGDAVTHGQNMIEIG